jgi:hypothetical protein
VRQSDDTANAERTSAAGSRWDALILAVCVLLPMGLAIVRVANTGDAAHDEGVVRAVGLGWTGGWRALDAPFAALLAWIPLGTRVARAALASTVACGVAGGALFVVARGLVRRVADTGVLGSVVAGIASLAATLSPAWLVEGCAPAGSCLGASLVLLAGAMGSAAPDGLRALVCGIAMAYEPLVGAAAIAAAATAGGARWRRALPWFAVGLVPFFVGLARRVAPLAMDAGVFARPFGERGESPAGAPLAVMQELGTLSCVAVVAGAVVAWLAPEARRAAGALAAVVAVGLVAMVLGAPAGPSRYGAPVLAAIGAAYAIAAVAMQGLVRVVDQARVPYARASASMILVLEAAIPARAADDASVRADARQPAASGAWNDAAFGALPADTALLVGDPRVHARLLATRAAGEMRADVAVVPLFDLAGPAALHELARDPKLQSLWHDALLVGSPQEASLSALASSRPITLPFDPAWERALARHLVPAGLFERFEPEPRGASDRRRALDETALARETLARLAGDDRELQALTASLLRARLVAFAAAGERDVIGRGIDDLRPFAPRDALSAELVRRMSLGRGAIDLKDLPR